MSLSLAGHCQSTIGRVPRNSLVGFALDLHDQSEMQVYAGRDIGVWPFRAI